jgi:threonine/homoserine efflux transporter RhtA
MATPGPPIHLDEKDAYGQTGELFRHYLSWREKLLAGYFAVLGGLAIAFGKMRLSPFKPVGILVPILAAIVSAAFLALDRRNAELFDACTAVGHQLEANAGVAGPFTKLNSAEKQFRHRTIVAVLYGIGFLGSVIAAIVTYYRPQ